MMKKQTPYLLLSGVMSILVLIIVIVSSRNENHTAEQDEKRIDNKVVLKFGHDMPVSSAQHEAALK